MLACCLLACQKKDDSSQPIITTPPTDTIYHALYPDTATYFGLQSTSSTYVTSTPRDTTFDSTYHMQAMITYPDSNSITFHLFYWEHPSPAALSQAPQYAKEVNSFRKNSDGVYTYKRSSTDNTYSLKGDSLIIHHNYKVGISHDRHVDFAGARQR